ncbi:MAG: hypothetical protein NT070_06000 [Cyanobacteria bacterium]|nr:hypothetical protein [Cyanobacteriota bacterium]
MKTIDPRYYILPKSDFFPEECFSHGVVKSRLDLLPTDDKIIIGGKTTTNIITPESISSSCRHCRHYVHEGRRGGQCEQLNVSVQSGWDACLLSQAIFLDAPIVFPIVTCKSPEYCTAELNRCETPCWV